MAVSKLGWRAALLLGAIVLLTATLTAFLARTEAPRWHPAQARQSDQRGAGRVTALRLWMLAGALGALGVSSAATFFVPIAVSSGLSAHLAGLLYLIAGVIAVCVRVLAGLLADRHPAANAITVAAMMVTGAVGLAILSVGTAVPFAVGALLAVAGGWGWTGLILSSALRLLRGDPARASAAMQLGLFTGTAAGPVYVGAVGGVLGTGVALIITAGAALLAAIAVLGGVAAARSART